MEPAARPVAIRREALWCRGWLDSFAELVRHAGSFAAMAHQTSVLGLIGTALEVYRELADDGA